jgi:hypothetical protein
MDAAALSQQNRMYAHYIAAQAFNCGGLGIIHSLSHAVSAFYDTHLCLTPEPRYSWQPGRRDLPGYAAYCDRVYVVRDLRSLERAGTIGTSPAR